MIQWILGIKFKLMLYGGIALAVAGAIVGIYSKGRAEQKTKHALKQLQEYADNLEKVHDNIQEDKNYEDDIRKYDNPRDELITRMHNRDEIDKEDT